MNKTEFLKLKDYSILKATEEQILILKKIKLYLMTSYHERKDFSISRGTNDEIIFNRWTQHSTLYKGIIINDDGVLAYSNISRFPHPPCDKLNFWEPLEIPYTEIINDFLS